MMLNKQIRQEELSLKRRSTPLRKSFDSKKKLSIDLKNSRTEIKKDITMLLSEISRIKSASKTIKANGEIFNFDSKESFRIVLHDISTHDHKDENSLMYTVTMNDIMKGR